MYRISEFAVYLGAFAVARGKTQASGCVHVEGRGERAGNRRSGFAPVVSEGFREVGNTASVVGMGKKWKKRLPASLTLLLGESLLKGCRGRS